MIDTPAPGMPAPAQSFTGSAARIGHFVARYKPDSKPMNNRYRLLPLLLSAGLAACGGGGGDSATPAPATPEIVAKINDPAFLVGVIPAKTYEGQNSDVTTVSVFNYLVTHEGVSTDTVYTMTKSMFENLDQMSAAHSAAKAIKKENAAKAAPAPLHPGAEKYYREIGLIK